MKSAGKIKVGISIGDLNGIGSEIVLKTFEDVRMLELCTPVIFASAKLITFFKKRYNSEINFQGVEDASQAIDGKVNVVNVWKENVNVNFGTEDKDAGAYAFKSLEAATAALKKGDVDVLVTAPINKHTIQSENFKFPGHTDYLAKELEGESLMFMTGEEHLREALPNWKRTNLIDYTSPLFSSCFSSISCFFQNRVSIFWMTPSNSGWFFSGFSSGSFFRNSKTQY